ncbi:MAG: sugar transferase [bacterium]|nr:sugar transferase [bacterium]
MDIVVAFAALVLLSPLFLAVAVLVKLDSPGSILFRQERLGKNGSVFRILKFRTMVKDADQMRIPVEQVRKWEAERSDPRVTRVGKWLRRTGIDEFPQLLNILKGDISLVGPRPYYLRRMDSDPGLKERLSVKPGFVSLALVRGGVHLSEEEIKKYDQEYMEKQSLWLDIAILLKAVYLLLSGKGF